MIFSNLNLYAILTTLFDHIRTHIRLKRLGDADAFLRLVVLKEGSDNAGKSKC